MRAIILALTALLSQPAWSDDSWGPTEIRHPPYWLFTSDMDSLYYVDTGSAEVPTPEPEIVPITKEVVLDLPPDQRDPEKPSTLKKYLMLPADIIMGQVLGGWFGFWHWHKTYGGG